MDVQKFVCTNASHPSRQRREVVSMYSFVGMEASDDTFDKYLTIRHITNL
jgi:hypothetical protein